MNESKANRLIHETSPYLLQHAYNPVDWWPWSDEAFQKARAENKPVLLSAGYSACHWCHVMEKESFENEEIAELMNRYFINIKVDREERPDLDQLYQQAVQMIVGAGGWPLTVFLDHDRKPFFGGTYFPPAPRYSRAGFPQVLQTVHEKWEQEREQLLETGSELLRRLDSKQENLQDLAELPDQDLPLKALAEIEQHIDQSYGGFGHAPKFPNPTLLQLLLKVGTSHGNQAAPKHVVFTLKQMARGGVYDQLAGGFHRYATDERWLVPHFEKMLYDNAQLLKLYAIGYQITGLETFQSIIQVTIDYVRREMTSAEGGFYATQDADSEGKEGKYYLWTIKEIREILTAEEADFIIDYYNLSAGGNFEGKNILNRLGEKYFNSELLPAQEAKLSRARMKLFHARELRVKPFLDKKIITGWNGMMIGALAYIYQVFQREEDYRSAVRGARFILDNLREADGTLKHAYKDGQMKVEAFLDDYAFLSQGLIDLYETDFDEKWLIESLALTKSAFRKFSNGNGLYYLASDHGKDLITRPVSGRDEAFPSGVSVHAENLLRLSSFTGEKELLNEAEKIFTAYSQEMENNFWGFAGMIQTLDLYYQGFQEFTFLSRGKEIPEILRKLHKKYLPYRILVFGNTKANLESHPARELLKERALFDNKPTCYACLAYSCLPPVTEWEKLEEMLFE